MDHKVLNRQLTEWLPDKSAYTGGELYVSPDIAAGFVIGCAQAGVAVMGIETFVANDAVREPRLDLIFDTSDASFDDWQQAAFQINSAALRFLKGLPGGTLVTLVTLPHEAVLTERSDPPGAT
jgi:hypothetical protein